MQSTCCYSNNWWCFSPRKCVGNGTRKIVCYCNYYAQSTTMSSIRCRWKKKKKKNRRKVLLFAVNCSSPGPTQRIMIIIIFAKQRDKRLKRKVHFSRKITPAVFKSLGLYYLQACCGEPGLRLRWLCMTLF